MPWQGIVENMEEIAADRTHGARELAIRCARAMLRRLAASEVSALETAGGDERRRAARILVGLQPEMAPFYHLAAVLNAASTRDELVSSLSQLLARIEGGAASERGAALIAEGARVTTFSRSGSVLAALRLAHGGGKRFSVIVAEARPGFEGRTVAVELAELGVAVELVTDAALSAVLGSTDLVLMGADAIGRDFFLNKVGTRAVCVYSRELGKPVYVIADESKLLPEELWRTVGDRDPQEVWADAPAGISIRNPYFERIPSNLVSEFILGPGASSGAAVAERVDSLAAALAELDL